ncbi:MAG: hypothetical protein CM15mV94_160 [uncultured marine virus]|nr:MAG: hypothetical protein CM15mV94_160 [uncultured marine virus]
MIKVVWGITLVSSPSGLPPFIFVYLRSRVTNFGFVNLGNLVPLRPDP